MQEKNKKKTFYLYLKLQASNAAAETVSNLDVISAAIEISRAVVVLRIEFKYIKKKCQI